MGAIVVGLPAPRTEEEPKRSELKGRAASSKTMQSGSPEAQNMRRRSRFLNALRSRRGDRFTAVPKKSGFNVVTKD